MRGERHYIIEPMRIAVIVGALLAPSLAFAQFGVSPIDQLTLDISPKNPRPYATVTVTPQSSLINLANSTMTLSVDGTRVYSGPTQSVSVAMPGPGRSTTVVARVTSLGQTSSASMKLTPTDVSIVIEPFSTTPALYKGKPMPAQSGRVRLVAVADLRSSPTARLDPDTLSYTWSIDGTRLINSSGIGKHSVILPSPLPYRSQTVSVTVVSPGGSLTGSDSLSLSSSPATLRLYIHDPLQGTLFDHALNTSQDLAGTETTFVAVPYSFTNANGSPTIQWFVNDELSETGPAITLRTEGAGSGTAALTATVTSGLEALSQNLSLSFGQSTNFFGL